jgi:hypothetical protein
MRNTRLYLSIGFALIAAIPVAAQEPQPDPAIRQPAAIDAFAPAATTGQSTSDPPFFKDFKQDLTRLGWKANLFTLGAGGALALAVHPTEARLGAIAARSEDLDEVLDAGAISGSGWVQIGGALSAFAFSRVSDNPRMRQIGTDLFQAQLLNSMMTQSIKFAAGRTRPDGGRFSFPSGHTSGTFASATVLARHFGWKFGVPAYGVATYVAASRVQANRHYISDVIMGAAIGVVAGRTVTIGKHGQAFEISPSLTPGGVGFTIIHERR